MSKQEQRVIACPACGRRFRLPKTGGPRPGQRLRCGSCGHLFRFEEPAAPQEGGKAPARPAAPADSGPGRPEGTPPEEEAPPSAAVPEDDGDENGKGSPPSGEPHTAAAAADEDDHAADEDNHAQVVADSADAVLRALRERNQGRRRQKGKNAHPPAGLRRLAVGLGWLAWLAFLGGVVWLLLAAPEAWRREWPLLERAHALLAADAPESAPLTLTLANRGMWEKTPQGWRLSVDGIVHNRSDRMQVIPPIIVLLRDDAGRIRAKAIARPVSARVPPHGKVGFVAELERIHLDGDEQGGITVVAEFARIEPRPHGPEPASPRQAEDAGHGQQENGHGPHPGR